MSQRILVVDDEHSLCEMMRIMLGKEGYEVDTEQDGRNALLRLTDKSYDLVIADLKMPQMSGLELLNQARQSQADLPVIVMTAFASVETAIEALKNGAADYVTKPFQIEQIKLAIRKTLETSALKNENRALKERLGEVWSFDRILSTDQRMDEVKRIAAQAAVADTTILIRGESGTGKDLVAQAIHQHSPRRDKPYVAVNCAALPETLLESELFGHVKGSFTGAIRDHEGLFRAAEGGTLFLDEISEITPTIQVKLLRVLENKNVTPIGSTAGRTVDVRVVAATNADIEAAVASRKFRPDLYYRLNVIQIHLPPLRERADDVMLLSDFFTRASCERAGCPMKQLSPAALAMLKKYPWPGNVRELQNVIERAVVLSKKPTLDIADFPEKLAQPVTVSPASEGKDASPTLESIEKAYIYWVLNQTEWQKAKAAQILGIDSSTLYRKISKYKFSGPRSGAPDAPTET
ncbi:MAG: sigma-54-dependent Fis family transcriptional regulator [candidate division Zixibacteria bacterium]|nr:sigma-54-dependent Fis family transcriptional regulator [candidate division Zixibacteria bacterium]